MFQAPLLRLGNGDEEYKQDSNRERRVQNMRCSRPYSNCTIGVPQLLRYLVGSRRGSGGLISTIPVV
jgi:hypothetical protein